MKVALPSKSTGWEAADNLSWKKRKRINLGQHGFISPSNSSVSSLSACSLVRGADLQRAVGVLQRHNHLLSWGGIPPLITHLQDEGLCDALLIKHLQGLSTTSTTEG